MSYEYDRYLEQHISNVKKGFDWMKENIPEYVFDPNGEIEANLIQHDQSKRSEEEYDAYDQYFYGNNKSYAVVQNFDLAWLHHIHVNPHHWQHWVLVNDDPEDGTVALDMPYEVIVEMICDWWAFSWVKGDLTEIFDWYEDHKERMILSDKTRKTVEKILDAIKEKNSK